MLPITALVRLHLTGGLRRLPASTPRPQKASWRSSSWAGAAPMRRHLHTSSRFFVSSAASTVLSPRQLDRRLFSSTLTSSAKSKRSTKRGRYALLLLPASAVALLLYHLYDPTGIRWYGLALARSVRTTLACAVIAVDYKLTLGRSHPSDDAYAAAKRACHQRAAEWMLWVSMSNGGVYIKLGQHLAALVYLLPEEYTNTLKVLQDQCPPTAMEAMERMVLADTGSTLADHFDEFDRVPLGAASLAQVHKAKLRSTGATVAVKLQHPHLDEHAPVDIRLCSWFAERVKRLFPDFEFDWLAEEVRESLPRELDFAQEAENAREVARNFRGSTVVKIPEVVWATRRILVMEFIEGAKVDNVEYMRHNNINLLDLSNELAKAFYKMIFYDGFVHCDPHPGNVFVRPVKRSAITIPFVCQLFGLPWRNYEIVLLDHGLYRRLPSSLRLDYAHLWDSILRGDEPGILKYSHRIFTRHTPHHQQQSSDGIQHHRLFASMLTGRSWRRITAGNNSLASRVSAAELQEVAEKAATGRFFQSIAEVLAKLPREVLLLLKTGDLLRAVDDSLMVDGEGGGAVVTGMYRRVGLMLVFCAVAIREKRVDGLGAWDVRVWWAWLDYWAVVGRLVALEVWLAARRVMAA